MRLIRSTENLSSGLQAPGGMFGGCTEPFRLESSLIRPSGDPASKPLAGTQGLPCAFVKGNKEVSPQERHYGHLLTSVLFNLPSWSWEEAWPHRPKLFYIFQRIEILKIKTPM